MTTSPQKRTNSSPKSTHFLRHWLQPQGGWWGSPAPGRKLGWGEGGPWNGGEWTSTGMSEPSLCPQTHQPEPEHANEGGSSCLSAGRGEAGSASSSGSLLHGAH